MSQWEVWRVVYRGTNPPKQKYLAIAYVSEEANYVCGFFISSEPRAMLQTPENSVCMVEIACLSHPFLSHDSILAVHQLITIPRADFLSQLGRLDPEAVVSVRTAIEQCPALGRKSKSLIL